MRSPVKPGYLYVLTHPSDPNLYKVGQTTRNPEKRLLEHNNNHEELAGQLVKETGQKWELKTYIEVPDPHWAESVFWGSTPFPDLPYLGKIEIHKMEWHLIKTALDAAKQAGIRQSPKELPDHVYAYTAWMRKRLESREITLLGYIKSRHRGARANFLCNNGHKWRTDPESVAEGAGCPECGAGERSPEEMQLLINPAYLNLLINPNKPGFIKIVLECGAQKIGIEETADWVVHRFRNVEETPNLAETLIWELIGIPKPNHGEEIEIDLHVAEEAFRELIYRIRYEIALKMKKQEKRFQ